MPQVLGPSAVLDQEAPARDQRVFAQSRNCLFGAMLAAVSICALSSGAEKQKPKGADPVFEKCADAQFEFGGVMGDRIRANVKNWLLTAPDSNPAMLQMFRDRDRAPRRDLVPWAGEFAGKYLISATQALRMTRDPELEAYLKKFVADLIATQDSDGYMGPFPKDARMTGAGLWDLWGQYHVMLGLLYWYRLTGDTDAIRACRKCADYYCAYFLDGGKRVVQAGSEEMNESSIHIFTLLYEETGDDRYLQMAREIEKDWETAPSGDYVRAALAGKKFYEMPKPRWESLHSIQAIAELYFITGEEKYKEAFTKIWKSILENDIHNTGGFSSGEQATGNPYDPRPIETCCTIAWMAVTIDYLRMTGDPLAADWLEIATWNAVLGAQNPTGRWWTYNTPMDGERKAAAHDIVFQARAGSPELNCCSVNGPRGLGMLSEWAVMRSADGIVVNYYGPSKFTIQSPSGKEVKIEEPESAANTWGGWFNYPGISVIKISPETPEHFCVRLRIPFWSPSATIALNNETAVCAAAGSYFVIDREWKPKDEINLSLNLTEWIVEGKKETAGKVSIYQGAILLAHDPAFSYVDPANLTPIVLEKSKRNPTSSLAPQTSIRGLYAGGGPIVPITWTKVSVTMKSGSNCVRLRDFATAGATGTPYLTWFPYVVEGSQ